MVDVPAGATKMPQPVDINVRQAMSSPLITDFPPLPSQNVIMTGPRPVYPSNPVAGQPVRGFPPIFPNPPGRPGRGRNPGGGGGTNVGTGSTTTGTQPQPQPPGGKGPGKGPTLPPGTVVGPTGGTPTPGPILRTLPTQPGRTVGGPAGNAN